MPYYEVMAGGRVSGGTAELAAPLGSVPAKAVPELLADAIAEGATDSDALRALVATRVEAFADEAPDDYYRDFHSDEPFSLDGRGPGECGAGVLDVVKVDIDEAKALLKRAEKGGEAADESVHGAIVSAARSLLMIYGLEPKKDREVFAAFREKLVEPGWVSVDSAELTDAAMDWRVGDRDSLTDLIEATGGLTKRVDELFASLDSHLAFRAAPVEQGDGSNSGDERGAHVADLRTVACPINFVKAKIALSAIPVGEVLDVLLDEGEPMRNVPASFSEQGQEVLAVEREEDHYRLTVRRIK